MPELLRLEHFGFTYPQQPHPALADVSLTVRQGEFWVLCGASGCGKTTLLRQLKPALRPHGAAEGCILFDGQPLDDLPPHRQAADIGFVLQSPEEQTVTASMRVETVFLVVSAVVSAIAVAAPHSNKAASSNASTLFIIAYSPFLVVGRSCNCFQPFQDIPWI